MPLAVKTYSIVCKESVSPFVARNTVIEWSIAYTSKASKVKFNSTSINIQPNIITGFDLNVNYKGLH